MAKPIIPVNLNELEDIAESLLTPHRAFGDNLGVLVTGDYIILSDIVCTDADGRVFEMYDQIAVATDVFRRTENYDGKQIKKHLLLTPYQAVVHCQQNGLFLPSSALMVNIHYALFEEAVEIQPDGTYKVKDPAAEKVLRKFHDRGDGAGGHFVNTLICYNTKSIIHYPSKDDFPNNHEITRINVSHPRQALPFDNDGFTNCTLEQALQLPNYKRFLQNYTGLRDPTVLLTLAKYHGKTARSWVSSSNETRAAWFGCNDTYLNLNANNYLNNNNAARGVKIPSP